MIDITGEDVNLIIDNLCMKFNTTVDNLIPELIKLKTVSAVASICVCIIFMTTGLIMFRKAINIAEDELSFGWAMLSICMFVFLVITFICFGMNMYKLIVWSNAPYGAAIEYILQLLRN